MNKKIFIFLSILTIFGVFGFAGNVNAAECTFDVSGKCTCDGYCCEGDTMCCTGGGCPSYACLDATYRILQTDCGEWQCCYRERDYAMSEVTCYNMGCTCVWDGVNNVAIVEHCRDYDGYTSLGTCEYCDGLTCFVEGTKITMADGTKKNIEDVKVGESIQSLNDQGQKGTYEVLELDSPIREGYYKVKLEDGTELGVTNEHPLFFKNDIYQGWGAIDPTATYNENGMTIKQFKTGDYLYKEDNNWHKINSIIYVPGAIQTYNLKSVANINSFFADGVYAHNKTTPSSCVTPNPAPIQIEPTRGSQFYLGQNVRFNWVTGTWPGDCNDRILQLRFYEYQGDDNWNYVGRYTWEGAAASNTTSVTIPLRQNIFDYHFLSNKWYGWEMLKRNERGTTRSPIWSFYILPTIPPTAQLYTPPHPYTVLPGTEITATGRASDNDSNVTGLEAYRIKTVDEELMGFAACSGATQTCDLVDADNASWTPTEADVGDWLVFLKAFSEDDDGTTNRGRCTGRVYVDFPSDWWDCGDDSHSLVTVTVPPTGQITDPVATINIDPGDSYTFSANGQDAEDVGLKDDLLQVGIFGRFDNGDGTYGSEFPITSGGLIDCADTENCDVAGTWNTVGYAEGTYVVYVKAYDEYGLSAGSMCTGYPEESTDWHDCARDLDGDPDHVTVTVGVNILPVATELTGHVDVRTSNSDLDPYEIIDFARAYKVGMYNVIASDADGDEIKYTWSSSCPISRPNISSLTFRAVATDSGGLPVISVITSDATGTRRAVHCAITVGAAWQVYNCDVNAAASSIDLVYNEDTVGDNLQIQYLDVYYADGSYTRVSSLDNLTDGNYVRYDQATLPAEPSSPYDGLNAQDGTQSVANEGSLRFPIPVSFSPGSSPTSCTITATVSDTAVGNSVSKAVNICGAVPNQVTGLSPDGDNSVELTSILTWTALENDDAVWGDTCFGTSADDGYIVYLQTAAGGCDVSDFDPNSPLCGTVAAPISRADSTPSCTPISELTKNTDYCWFVRTTNGEYFTDSEVKTFRTTDPVKDKEWLTAIGGNVFFGGLWMDMPDQADEYKVPWSAPRVVYENALNIPVLFHVSGDPLIIAEDLEVARSESNFWTINTDVTSSAWLWPGTNEDYGTTPPQEIIDLRDLDNTECEAIFTSGASQEKMGGSFDPESVYTAPVDCIQEGINNITSTGTSYHNEDDGVVVVYVTGNGLLEIKGEFKSDDPDKRLIFVTGDTVDVVIKPTKEDGTKFGVVPTTVDFNTAPLVEASFLTLKKFKTEGIGNYAEGSADYTLVIEGPVMAKEAEFNRNVVLDNGFPSEVIKYNNKYLYDLTVAERASDSVNMTGLFVSRVSGWPGEFNE